MNDHGRSLELEDEITKLNTEIEEYCWNVRELSQDEKNDIRDLYRLWKTSFNKKIVIDNIHNSNIRISDNVVGDGKVLWEDVKPHHSFHFIDCSNITIVINPKVNHVTLEKCNNVNFRSVGGSISGMDLINSSNITSVFNSKYINFMDISNATQCLFILSETIAKNIMITSTSSFNLNFKVIADGSGVTKSTYKTNMNVFQDSTVYRFNSSQDGDGLVLHVSIPKLGDDYDIQQS